VLSNPKTGKVRGKDGNIYDNVNQAAKEQGIGAAPEQTQPTPPQTQPNKTPQKPLSAY